MAHTTIDEILDVLTAPDIDPETGEVPIAVGAEVAITSGAYQGRTALILGVEGESGEKLLTLLLCGADGNGEVTIPENEVVRTHRGAIL